MAFEELLQLLSKVEAVAAKQDGAMSLLMLATAESLASEELTPGDPEWKAIAARGEALGREVVGKAAGSAETFTRRAAEFAARPGGEAVAEAHRRIAGRAVALRARAEEFAVYMHRVGELTLDDSDTQTRSQKGGPLRGGPGGPMPDTLGRSGPTDGSSPTGL